KPEKEKTHGKEKEGWQAGCTSSSQRTHRRHSASPDGQGAQEGRKEERQKGRPEAQSETQQALTPWPRNAESQNAAAGDVVESPASTSRSLGTCSAAK